MNKLLLALAVLCFASCAEPPPPAASPIAVTVGGRAGCFPVGNPCVAVSGGSVTVGGGSCCSGACTNGICQ